MSPPKRSYRRIGAGGLGGVGTRVKRRPPRRPADPQTQRDLLDKLATATHPRTRLTDEQLIAVAQRYLTLCQFGVRHPLPQIAKELGISRQQARDRVRKAREKHFLAAGDKGRATATIGPALKKLGWNPPLPHPTQSDSSVV